MSSASQEIPLLLLYSKVPYHIHKSPLPVPILSHSNPIRASPSHFLKIHFNIVLASTPRSSEWSLFLGSPHHKPVCTSHLPPYVPLLLLCFHFLFFYCAVLKRLPTPSDFHIPLPSIVPFACPELSSTHSCIYPIFTRSSGTTSFLPPFRFPVDHNFWQSRSVRPFNMSVPNKLFSSYVIQYRVLGVHFISNILIRFSI